MEAIKYIDLCSGIGGFRIAIENTKANSFECVLSADIKQDAIDTYNINFKENNTKKNIYSINPAEIQSFDLLCCGFPCQPFSSAGQKKGFSDKRGGLIFKIVEICKYHKPQNILLENVYNLITLQGGKCIRKIKQLFEDLGYFVTYKKLNSKDFGCPQSRERVYIICNLEKEIRFENIQFSEKKYLKDVIDYSFKKTDIEQIFAKKLIKLHKTRKIFGCKISDKRGGKDNIHSWDIGHNGYVSREECNLMNQIMLQRRKKHWAIKKKISWMDGMPLTTEEIATFYKNDNLQNMLNNLVKHKYLRLEKCKDLVDGKREYKQDSEEGYNICKGKLSFPVSKILDPYDISPTLTATDSKKLAVIIPTFEKSCLGDKVHQDENVIRSLTANEMKKLCGFPDNFIIPKHVNYYNLFGNMATPPAIEALLKLIYHK